MSRSTDFNTRLQACEELMGRWKLQRALEMTQLLLKDFPKEPRAYSLYNLAICLTNREGGALLGTPKLINAVQLKLSANRTRELLIGDLMRDQAISLITFARGAIDLQRAEKVLNKIGRHSGDFNRQACLVGVRCRLAFAWGDYAEAIEHAEHAAQLWHDLGDQANQIWMGHSAVHGLRAVVARYGRKSPEAKKRAGEIVRAHPNEASKVKILLAPGGRLLFSYLMTHR